MDADDLKPQTSPVDDIDGVLLKAVFATAVDAILVITEAGRIQMVNPATEKLFGYAAHELMDQNVSMLMPKPHQSRHDGYLQNYLDTGERKIIGIGREVFGRRKDGSTFPMYLSVAEARHGERRYFTGIIHDLSRQMAMETALRKSEQHLRDVTEAASDWTWEMDTQFRLSYVSERFYGLTGVAQTEVVGRTRWELAGQEAESEVWRRHRADLERHRPFSDFIYSPRIGGAAKRNFYFKVSGKPVYDSAGRFLGYRGTGTDVTDHVLAKHALRESRRSLETLVSNVAGMVYRCRNDRDWSMEFVSEGGRAITGYRPAELVAGEVSYASLIHAQDQEGIWQEVQRALSAGSPFDLTYRINTASDGEKWVWERGCGVYDESGAVMALEGVILDINEHMQTEQALRALATSTVVGGGQDFVADCARELARTYGARYTLVGVFTDASNTAIHTLAFWNGDAFSADLTFPVAGTPCEAILAFGKQIVPSAAASRHPEDRLLRELEVEGYFGTPLIDSVGHTLGLILVMDTRAMQPNVWTQPILGIFANRLALELERQQADDRLRQSETFLRLTLENAPIGISSTDLEGRLLDTNPALCALLGYSRAELTRMSVFDYTHPDDREVTRRYFEALRRGEINSCKLRKRFLNKAGSVIHVRVQAALIRDADGHPLRVVGEVEDETERRKAAQEIRRMRAYLKNIIDSMPSVLVGVDAQGRVTQWNRWAEKGTGITSAQAVGRPIQELIPELAGQVDNITEAIRRRQPVRTQRLPLKDTAETRYADVMVYPLLENDVMGAVIRMDDITERIRIEQMMVQTEKMLSVGGLAAGMAHEINNPLSIVMQSAQNILRRFSPDLAVNQAKAEELGLDLDVMQRYLEARNITGFLQGILEAGGRAGRIVADMLAFSRRSSSECLPNQLDEMLETVVRLAASDYDLKKKYDFKQIELVRDYAADLGSVCCDRQQMEQVFLNLVKNAAHAMVIAQTAPPRRIVLRTRREGEMACIEIEDNGPGMDEVTRKRAFEPFFTTKEVGVGTGLGLSVSYFIITEQHKGSITVRSGEGKGCTFTIRIPINGASDPSRLAEAYGN